MKIKQAKTKAVFHDGSTMDWIPVIYDEVTKKFRQAKEDEKPDGWVNPEMEQNRKMLGLQPWE